MLVQATDVALRRVFVANWQMQCCGTPFAVGSDVSWFCIEPDGDWLPDALGTELAATVTDVYEHHGAEAGRESWTLEGAVRSIDAVSCRYARREPDPRAPLYPVRGTTASRPLSSADGWEGDHDEPDDVLSFLGYVVDVEPTSGRG